MSFLLRRDVMVLRPLLGVVEGRQELMLLNDDFAEREPALAQLAAAAVAGLLPAGPDMRQRQPIALRGQPDYARSSCQRRHRKPSPTQRILTVSTRPRIGLDIARTPKLTTSSACYVTSANLSNLRNARLLATRRTSKRRCCGASWVSSTDCSSAPPTNPCILENWVWRRFVLLGKFESTLPSSTPAHSPIVACAARWLSTTMVGFPSAAKAPATQTVTPLLV